VSTLCSYFAFFTDGDRPYETFAHSAGSTAFVMPLRPMVLPGPNDHFFGPHAGAFSRVKASNGFLLAVSRDAKAGVGSYFTDVRRAVLQVTQGMSGWGLDVLKLTPFPLSQTAQALPEDFLAEDVFTLGLSDRGVHGIRAETFGLSKLGQHELTFTFTSAQLMEEAQLFCGHVCDWLIDHGQRLSGNSQLAFGLDTVHFRVAGDERAARAWHAPFICQLLPEAIFPGVGAVEVKVAGNSGQQNDLTGLLKTAQAQRQILDEYDVTGSVPQGASMARVAGTPGPLVSALASREEARDLKDSGWRLVWPGGGQTTLALREVVGVVPDLAKYLALPVGARISWNSLGAAVVDTSTVSTDSEGDE
jgi:hypothetical protein